MSKYIKAFQESGPVIVDVDYVVKDWGILWVLYEHRSNNNWKLVRYLRKDSWTTKLKVTISPTQAKELVNTLGLREERAFGQSFEWRTQLDRLKFQTYKLEKYAKKNETR